jgi:hypothetical protein
MRYLTFKLSRDQVMGLSNVMMMVANAAMYAAMDNRVLVLPWECFIELDRLFDLPRTRQALLALNVVVITRNESSEVKWAKWDAPRTATAPMVHWNDYALHRMVAPNHDFEAAENALEDALLDMHHTRDRRYATMPDFAIPLLAPIPMTLTKPFDNRFFFRRMVFHERLRLAAVNLLRRIKSKRGVSQLMAVHLRLESDSFLLIPGSAKAMASPENLRNWIRYQLVPLAKKTGCDGIYIACGKIPLKIEALIRHSSVLPIIFKTDFPDAELDTAELQSEEWRTKVTSIDGAVVDLLILEHSTVAVMTLGSTFLNTVHARRCSSWRSRSAAPRVSKVAYEKLIGRSDQRNVTETAEDPAWNVEPPPGSGAQEQASQSDTYRPRWGYEGTMVFHYTDSGVPTKPQYDVCF